MRVIELNLKETICYLLPIKDKYLLIDTGYEKHRDLLHQELNNKNIKIKDIEYLLITHHHDDHAGLLNEIKSHNSSCKIIMHFNTKPLLENGQNNMTHAKYINKRIAFFMGIIRKLNKNWDFSFPPYIAKENDIIISKDIALSEIGIDIPGKIIFTPGHTDDSISLLLNDGNCFVGDAAANMLSKFGTKYCVIVIDDLDQYYESWDKIIKGNAKTIYPAHGKPFDVEQLKSNIYKNKKQKMKKIK
ncbi:MAG: MBL fold metallo-hydrolase [Vallitalea sp.]|jgi:glyoxylase-like metal-dependent hydrolase (beta-lactamase superfamily II)|nr:MBL fold metallo-hydrolase [Vallitalea sp.]